MRPEERKEGDLDDLDMSPEEYQKYKRDILKDLEKEKQKNNYQEMNDMISNGILDKSKVKLQNNF